MGAKAKTLAFAPTFAQTLTPTLTLTLTPVRRVGAQRAERALRYESTALQRERGEASQARQPRPAAVLRLVCRLPGLHGRRRCNRRLWRRLARAAEALAGRPVGRPLFLGVPSCPEPQGAP